MAMFKKILSLLLVCMIAALGFCMSFAEDKLNIVCTSFPCYDFVRAVAGDRAEIRMLIKPGAEVHSFEPTPADVMSIAGCDLFVYIGGESDAWVVDILESFGSDAPDTLRFFECIEAAETEHSHDHADAHAYDEHIWTSPENAMTMVSALAEAMSAIDAENSEIYFRNMASYNEAIKKLDAEIERIVSGAVRTEMIFADRFPFLYFAMEYGISWHAAFESCSSESEPSAKTVAALIDRVRQDGVPAVYKLELSNGKTAQTIAGESGAKVLTFHSMQNVSEAEFSAGETYITLMQKNIEALKEGLN